MTRVGPGLSSAIREAAEVSPDSVVFRHEVLAALRRSVPFEAGCLGLLDPASLMPTSLTTVGYDDPGTYAAVFDIEYGSGEEPGRFEALRGHDVPISTLREATHGRIRSCRYYADVLAPHRLHDEVRMLFRGRDGLVWGGCTIARDRGSTFGDAEVARLGAVLADVGDGLRTTLFRASTHRVSTSPEGPAVAVVTPDNELESATVGAREWLDRLGWGSLERPVPAAPAVAAATWLRRSGEDSVALRARTLDGEWVVVRAGWQGPKGGNVVLTVERAHLPEVAALAAVAHGLTRRETEVLTHLLAGESRQEMSRTLGISPWTVQDHLRSIYAKTRSSGRRGLVAMLVRSEYLSRMGGTVGADGWFAAPAASGPAGPGTRRTT